MSNKKNWYWRNTFPYDGYTKEIIQDLSYLHITYEQEQKEWDLAH